MKIEQDLEAAVTFAILMQNIKDKSPGYIREKYESVKRHEEPRCLLDNNNLRILKDWMKTWHVEDK